MISYTRPKKVYQLFWQKLPKKANCIFSAHWFRPADGQTYNQVN